jgi:hypothetical protein
MMCACYERDAVLRFIREAAYTAWDDRPEGRLFLSLADDIENEEHLRFVMCRDSDGTATAALCEDIAAPQDCQARAEGIAQKVQP